MMWPFHAYHLFLRGSPEEFPEEDYYEDEEGFPVKAENRPLEEEPVPSAPVQQQLEEIEVEQREAEEEILQPHPTPSSGFSAGENLLRNMEHSEISGPALAA